MAQICVEVKAHSKKGPLVQKLDDRYLVYVREPAVDGMANQAVVRLLSKYLNVAPSAIKLTKGHRSKTKIFSINN